MSRVSWITGADRFVLQFLAGHEEPGFHAPPTVIASNIGYSSTHVRTRIGALANVGLVERVDEDRGYYAISELGERYLARELSDDEVDRIERQADGP